MADFRTNLSFSSLMYYGTGQIHSAYQNYRTMKKSYPFFILILALAAACSSVKNTQKAINLGDYHAAIDRSIENLAKNKTKKGHQAYVLMLEEAFVKNTERERKHIAFLKRDANPAHLEEIYKTYQNLRQIQQRIRPLLPLRIYEQKRNAGFDFVDYQKPLLESKQALSEYLYTNASDLVAHASTKWDYRQAYDDFLYLEEINPGFGDIQQKMETAYAKGQDYIRVELKNETDQIVPVKLQKELLNFNTYGLDSKWKQYHSQALPGVSYDYRMKLALNNISISPEQVREKQVIHEKQIKAGYRYATDPAGNVVKDSLGNKVKIDKFKTVQCSYYEFTQFKSVNVSGTVSFTDLTTNRVLNSYPLASEFIFEHIYADYDGDKRALEKDLLTLLRNTSVPFPSNEQMVYDAGEDLKSNLKSILVRQDYNTERTLR